MSEYIQAIDLRRGQSIIWNGLLYYVLDHSFNKTAMRGGIVKCKVKNIKTKAITIEDFSGMKFKQALITRTPVFYSYADDSFLHFLTQDTFVDLTVPKSDCEYELKFLTEGSELNLSVYEDEVLGINLPDIVSMTITSFSDDLPDTEQRKVITNTGLVLSVPKFCNVGDNIFVSTSDGKYKSR